MLEKKEWLQKVKWIILALVAGALLMLALIIGVLFVLDMRHDENMMMEEGVSAWVNTQMRSLSYS